MFKLKNKKGATLIEIVAVIAIIGIMTGATIVSFSKARTQAAVEGETEKLISVIREAQNYALTGKQASSECYEYRILTDGDGAYKLGNYPGPGCTLNSSFNLENGVKFESSVGVTFEAPHADNRGGGSFVLKKGSYKCTAKVNPTGLITKSCL
ncbi:MAG: prepilin-type N-terminal cleavage/methylation domain-containing protein [Candidatus Moraniibacteriota bacterium]